MRLLKSINVFVLVFIILITDKILCDTTTTLTSSDDGQALVISSTTIAIQTPSLPTTVVTEDSSTLTTTKGSDNTNLNISSDSKPEVESPETINSNGESTKPGILLKPEIYSFHIDSDIRYRYSRTYVTSRVVNRDTTKSQEVTFRVVLPETAFISKFIMEIDGVSYEAYVKEKKEAKRVYNQAQSQGQSAGLVELNTRNANVFDVNVNIKAQAKINFNLTYEELLSRRLGRYEQSISISPDQVTNVKDFQIVVNIEESQNITLLRVPNLRNDIDAQQDSEGNNQDAIIERLAPNKAQIKWRPTDKDQNQLAKQGITGKFVVQYDISRELDAGEVLVMNGYFVHFFAPANLPTLRKHVVFILDTSGSMWGRKMTQLKEAMQKILADLNTEDYFNILTFSSDVVLWSPENKSPSSPNSNWAPPPFHGEQIPSSISTNTRNRQPYQATPANIEKAQKFIQSLVASGGTNIQDSIVQALNLTGAIKTARDGEAKANVTTNVAPEIASTQSSTESDAKNLTTTTNITEVSAPLTILPLNVESLIIFLTDGEPTVGVTDPTLIQTAIQAANKNISVPLFSLAFGQGADFPFVRKLSLQNYGFARKIYEASDAAIQLKGFYNEIASPLLSNVTFNYTSPEYSIQNLTITKFPTVFGGTEIAVAGIIVPKDEVEKITESPTEGTTFPSPASSELLEEVQVEGNQVVPTEKKYFDVVIGGFGRNGHVQFNNPEIFSSPIPWGVPITKPFPPRPTPVPTQEDLFLERLWAYLTVQQLIEKDLAKQTTQDNEISDTIQPTTAATTTPTPTATSVISTITIGNRTITVNTTVLPETPKQRALRLALKYGFVTSLTSLVVVKPNSSDVTDAISANGNSDVADSLAAPQSVNYFQAIKPVHKVKFSAGRPSFFTSNRIAALPVAFPAPHIISSQNFVTGGNPGSFQAIRPMYALSNNAGMNFMSFSTIVPVPYIYATTNRPAFGSFITGPGSFGTYPIHPTSANGFIQSLPTVITIASEDADEKLVVQPEISTSPRPLESLSTSATPEISIVEFTTIEPEISPTKPLINLTLDDLTWFNESILAKINGSEILHRIALNETSDDDTSGLECGDTQSGHKGHCTHLKDCLIPAILDDYKLYIESYFCSIQSRSTGDYYAGTCCAAQPKKLSEE